MLYRIELNGKQLGTEIYTDLSSAQKRLSRLITESERRLTRAFGMGDLKTINALTSFNRALRKGVAVASYEAQALALVLKTEEAKQVEESVFSETSKMYQRLSSVHRKYSEIG